MSGQPSGTHAPGFFLSKGFPKACAYELVAKKRFALYQLDAGGAKEDTLPAGGVELAVGGKGG